MKPARLMIGLLLAWPSLLGGIALLDSRILPAQERQAALLEMHDQLAQEQGLSSEQVVRLRRGAELSLDRPAPDQLLAEK